MATTIQPGASVWAVRTRITALDSAGNLNPGANSFVTDQLVKATMTPVYEAGDQIAVKTAAGELGVYAIHGDIPKWYTVAIEFALPDPQLEQALQGGTVFTDSTAALGAPVSGPSLTEYGTGGTLPAGNYFYTYTDYNAYGETTASPSVEATVSGSAGIVDVILTGGSSGGLGWRIYGRSTVRQYLAQIADVGSIATGAASGTGSPTTLTLSAALTKAVPVGWTFTIAGDTNTTEILFTTTAPGLVGDTALAVSVSTSITTTIAAGTIHPTYRDTGAAIPSSSPIAPSVDLTGGPGIGVGYQAPAFGSTSNPTGVALEFWSKRVVGGDQATDYPYWRHVWPKVANVHIMPRDYTNANLVTMLEGNAFANPNFGTGPDGTWQFDSTKVYQRAMCGAEILPPASYAAVKALY